WKVEHQRARQTARLEFLYGQSIQAWQASREESLTRRQRKIDRGDGAGATIAELVSENQHGDPRYLEEARKALADLRKIWGVDAPARMSIEASPFASMSDEALEFELKRHLRLVEPSATLDVMPDSLQTDAGGAHEDDK